MHCLSHTSSPTHPPPLCRGKLNITSPGVHLAAWSFTSEVTTVPMQGAKAGLQHGPDGGRGGDVMHIVRFAGNNGAESFDFWVDVEPLPQQGAQVRGSPPFLRPGLGRRPLARAWPTVCQPSMDA